MWLSGCPSAVALFLRTPLPVLTEKRSVGGGGTQRALLVLFLGKAFVIFES